MQKAWQARHREGPLRNWSRTCNPVAALGQGYGAASSSFARGCAAAFARPGAQPAWGRSYCVGPPERVGPRWHLLSLFVCGVTSENGGHASVRVSLTLHRMCGDICIHAEFWPSVGTILLCGPPRALQLRTTFLDPRVPATAASQDSSPASVGSDSLEGRIAELERRLQVVVTHLQLIEALTDLHYRLGCQAHSLLQHSLAGLAQDTDCFPPVPSFLDSLD